MRNISNKSCRENETNISPSRSFFRKSCSLSDNVEECGEAREATDDNVIQSMRFACWKIKATFTHPKYVIPTAFPRRQCVTRTHLSVASHVQCPSCLLSCYVSSQTGVGEINFMNGSGGNRNPFFPQRGKLTLLRTQYKTENVRIT
jgi:hypothetical protein